MIARVLLLGGTATGLLVFGGMAWIQAHPAAPAPVPVAREAILVAEDSLEAGSLLKPEDLASLEVPVADAGDALPDTPENRGQLRGSMVRHALAAGERLRSEALVRPADHGFLAAVLDPGMRAMTVDLDQTGSDASLVWPGDRVDVLLVRDDTRGQRSQSFSVSSETVLSDLRVIAVDQRMMQGAMPGAASTQPARSITLELSPDQASRLAVALRLGKLTFAIRAAGEALAERDRPVATRPGSGPSDPRATATHAIVWAGDVSAASDQAPPPRPQGVDPSIPAAATPATIRILRGARSSLERF